MPIPSALACVRCGARYPIDRFAQDCPACRQAGAPANLTVAYDSIPGRGPQPRRCGAPPASMWRWDWLPAAPRRRSRDPGRGQHAASARAVARPRRRLDQGRIAQSRPGPSRTGWPPRRVTMAKRFGAKVIASSSSGNAGASAAAYAAKAGLPCVVFTFLGAGRPLVAQMRAYGAMVVEVENKADRWRLQSARRARVRLVSDLAVLRPGGRQQSLWHGRLQDDRLRDRRGLRLGSRPTGACCRSATATPCTACGKALRS